MKKIVVLLSVLALIMFSVLSCGAENNLNVDNNSHEANNNNVAVENNNTEENNNTVETVEETTTEDLSKPELSIATLKGPTGMGMVQLMENDELGTSEIDYTFDLVGAPDQIIGKVVQGEVMIAAVPSNLAAVLDVKTEGKIQLLAINTLGVLYVLENGDDIQTVQDLKGKTLHSSGKGASPEYVLNYILTQNEMMDDVTVEYYVEHSELAATTTAGDTTLSLLPQPFVTSTLLGNAEVRIALDLTEEWANVTDGSVLPMGGIIVNKEFAENNPEIIATFMKEYAASVEYVNGNPVEAGVLIEKFGIIPKAALATKAIPNCSITLIPAQEAKADVHKFFEILFTYDPKSVGGKLPEDSFYYED